MKPSSKEEVRKMYEETADLYDKMMDAEIGLSVYSYNLERLRERIAKAPGTLIDTACGSGDMLAMYHEQYDYRCSLLGVDLSLRITKASNMTAPLPEDLTSSLGLLLLSIVCITITPSFLHGR